MRYSYPKMTPGRFIGVSPDGDEDDEGNSQAGTGPQRNSDMPPAFRQYQSNMTEVTEVKQGYGKSMHAIESKPFEVAEDDPEQEEDEMPPEEEKEQPAQQLPSRDFNASAISRGSKASSGLGSRLDPVSRAYKTNPYLRESGEKKPENDEPKKDVQPAMKESLLIDGLNDDG